MIGRDPTFVFAIHRIRQEVEPAVGILELGNVICFPLRFLEHIRDAIATLGDAEIVEVLHARQ